MRPRATFETKRLRVEEERRGGGAPAPLVFLTQTLIGPKQNRFQEVEEPGPGHSNREQVDRQLAMPSLTAPAVTQWTVPLWASDRAY